MKEKEYKFFFGEIYSTYHHMIYAYIYARVNQKETAKDLLQETFLRVWNHIHVGQEMGLERSRFWIYRITKNLITDHYRRQSSRLKAQNLFKADIALMGAPVHSIEEDYERKDKLRTLNSAIQNLPEELRTVLVMQVIGKMNSTQIGEMLEMPAGTVRYRLSMARKRLLDDIMQSSRGGDESC